MGMSMTHEVIVTGIRELIEIDRNVMIVYVLMYGSYEVRLTAEKQCCKMSLSMS